MQSENSLEIAIRIAQQINRLPKLVNRVKLDTFFDLLDHVRVV